MVTHVLDSMNEVITNNYDTNHKAIDIVANDNSEANIIALESGTATTVVDNVKGPNHKSKGLATYGNYVKIKQNNGKTALYAHMKYGSVKVKKGEYVEKGTIIGTIGETGNAYGKHLHLEIHDQNNVKENPTITLNEPAPSSQRSAKNHINPTYNNSKNTTTTNKSISKNNQNSEFLSAYNYHYGSIVDALKSINIDSSYNYRKKLAKANNIKNYHGSYSQNIHLLNLLKEGRLKKA